MNVAKFERVIESNPCEGQFLPAKGRAVDRAPYDDEDLSKIFASQIYASGARMEGGGGEAQFWGPLIGLFAGLRMEELGQLLVDDIKTSKKITFFDVMEIDDQAEAAGKDSEHKAMKTENSRRKVPIHPFLIELGFLRFVAATRASGDRRLFPDLKSYRGRITKNWSRWWGRYADRYVTKSARKCFHSFRHSFAEGVRDATWSNEDAVKALIGHKKHMYGRTLSLKGRHEIICKIYFPDVDFSIVRAAAAKLGHL